MWKGWKGRRDGGSETRGELEMRGPLRRTESTQKDMELKVNVIGSIAQGLYTISHRRNTRLKGVVECLLYSDNSCLFYKR